MTFDFYSYGAKGTSLVFQSRDSLFIVYIAHEGVWVSTNSPKPAELLVAQVSTGRSHITLTILITTALNPGRYLDKV